MRLITRNAAKTVKGETDGIMTAITYLAPANLAGFGTVCRRSTKACRKGCLFSAGRSKMDPAIAACRLKRTRLWFTDRPAFKDKWLREAKTFINYAETRGFEHCARFNGTSDIKIEVEFPEIFDAGLGAVYDYTKDETRFGNVPEGYHLTYSLAETSASRKAAEKLLADGYNVAVVFGKRDDKGKPKIARTGYALPETFLGAPVFDGDKDDTRFRDPAGHVIGLRAKGEALKDDSGFVNWL